MNLFFLLFFSFINPVSWGAWIAVLIAFSIPWEYLGLWITSIIAAWTIVLFPLNRPYVDVHFDFSELVIYSTNLALFMGMLGVIIIRLDKNHHRQRERSAVNKLGKFLSFTYYGILSAYFSYLLLTDLWHDYQPAWQAYGVIFVGSFLIIIACWLFQTYRYKHQRKIWIKDLFTFSYSFAASTIVILISNLIFPILAIKETKKVIEYHGARDIKHCIQTSRKLLETWLYLTPLTAWNKPNGSQGAGLRHAVLVIDKNNEYILYHWSYKLREWKFTSVGFEPGAFSIPDSLKCTPKENYWSNLPFLFPEGKL